MILKQVIRYENDPCTLEATWVRYDQLPDTHVAATAALYDEEGNEVVPAVEAHTVPGEVVETVLRCHAYHATQMQELRADLGADASQYKDLLDEVEATYTPPPPPSAEEVIAAVRQAVQERLDAFARTRGYDGILSAATYATSTVPKFAAEGQYAVEARDATWAACYQIMDDVQQGLRPMPEVSDVLAELPPLAWPN